MTQKIILIYDDELAECIGRNVEARRPYLYITYTSARRLMEELPQLRFDLFLVDISRERDSIVSIGSVYDEREHELARISGADIGHKARKIYPHIPILSFSAWNEKLAFSNHHIEKPVSSEQLLGTLDDFLRD